MQNNIHLKGITWNHSRGFCPMVATAQRFSELNPGVEIEWSKRSLQAFADEPLEQLSGQFDLLVIDHPWAGFAAASGVIVPLDDYLSASYLEEQAIHSVGHSHESYRFQDRQWALAIDAATPVASSRPDLFKERKLTFPQTFEEVLDLAKQGLVAMPGIPIDSLMNFYMFCSTLGEDPCQTANRVINEEVGIKALQLLRSLAVHIDSECFDWNPIRVYENMTQRDDLFYCPFAYGYSNYARAHYGEKTLHFHDLVGMKRFGKLRSTLGGTGLAISATCRSKEMAAKYAAFVAAPSCQAFLYFDSGGQPGHRQAWMDERVNRQSNNFFRETLPALDRAFLRPRYDGYLFFQDHAGAHVRDYLLEGGHEKTVLSKLDELYLKSKNIGAI